MTGPRYTEEFKVEAVRQVVDRGHSIADVAKRLGITAPTLYRWVKQLGDRKSPARNEVERLMEENHRLNKELKRVAEERDILKKAAAYFARESG